MEEDIQQSLIAWVDKHGEIVLQWAWDNVIPLVAKHYVVLAVIPEGRTNTIGFWFRDVFEVAIAGRMFSDFDHYERGFYYEAWGAVYDYTDDPPCMGLPKNSPLYEALKIALGI